MAYSVYMLASRHRGLYVGVTGNLVCRLYQHWCGGVPGFTRRYGVERLVWFEIFDEVEGGHPARDDPQALAAGLEDRKPANPCWRDLYDEIAA